MPKINVTTEELNVIHHLRGEAHYLLTCPICAVPHGSNSTYVNYGCRCPECKDAAAEYRKARYDRARGVMA